jgi:hypothetical protein
VWDVSVRIQKMCHVGDPHIDLDLVNNNFSHDALEAMRFFAALNDPNKCREKRREMNGKMRGIEGNGEEWNAIDFFCDFSRFAAILMH